MGALKRASWVLGTAAIVAGGGYAGGKYVRAELARRINERLEPYGLHGDAQWVHPERGGIWVVDHLRVQDDAGHFAAHISQIRVSDTNIELDGVEAELHGTLGELRRTLLKPRAHVGSGHERRSVHRSLSVKNASLLWDGAGASWGSGPFDADVTRSESGTDIKLGGSPSFGMHVNMPSDVAMPVVAELQLGGFPVALVDDVAPLPEGINVHQALVSPQGTLALKRRADRADTWASLDWTGALGVQGFGLSDARLSDRALEGLSFTLSTHASFDGSRAQLQDGVLQMGALKALFDVDVTPFGVPEFKLNLNVPKVSCDALRAAVPKGLWTHLGDARLGGSFELRVHLDSAGQTDDRKFTLQTSADCTFESVPESLSPSRFRKAFSYPVVDKEGRPSMRTTGPGNDAWAPLDSIPSAMKAALLTAEDAGFYQHHGISVAAIRRAALKDLSEGKFVQGASTLSMQLAKNVYLARTKTLGRKVEELFLATLLEHGLQKDELLELYFNVVEFGPDVYGVKDAAMHYFGRAPSELSVAESFFLVGGLPAPKRLEAAWEKGTVPNAMREHLNFLLRTAHKRGHIDDLERARGAAEVLKFWRPGMPSPEPHDSWKEDPTDPGAENTPYHDEASYP